MLLPEKQIQSQKSRNLHSHRREKAKVTEIKHPLCLYLNYRQQFGKISNKTLG